MYEETTLEMTLSERTPNGFGGCWYGVYPAVVSDIKDPEGQGRVRVTLPWSSDTGSEKYEVWARLATMMAGNSRGSFFIPDVKDEVLVAFEGGNPRRPYVIGALWNGVDAPPEAMDGNGNNHKKVLKSRSGVKITLDDTSGQETLLFETPGGQKITLKDGAGSIKIEDSNGNSVKLEASGITVTASAKVTINASNVDVSAGMVKVDAGMAKFSGVVKADVIIANSVVSTSYTPGAGNIL
jgi:uncharacterized protein involved in type VI secretion and phage assembly